ncbi:uncharacterized protein BDR25DRAFT_12289 [Lindgomyces ingoldianus]|uniref:Uncharacterized protein n=1 Tax=Lindgomyces ingoldianus TaxID=673940 RepID=A0ACB6R0W3_9PLEO|nr:uncharacterized protein BDR25DRAFT_12289 [Lindgomyces ingoldianus]KAF2472888.1 hypothetical protein BDR25DRAFT_12289 [Lindgomyces ingoldianus]
MAPTFASAAAGNNANSSRMDSGGDWARRANGATQTFRRPSHAPTLSGSTAAASSREGSASFSTSTPNPGVYVPPHAQSGRNGSTVEPSRYSKDQLTQLFRGLRESEEIKDGLSNLYIGGWEPNISNGASSATWGRRDDHSRESQGGVDLCWDRDGDVLPLSLTQMTDEEKEHFTSSVNSPLKPPTQNAGKDSTPKDGLSLRKTSISQSGNAPFSLSSPTSTRPGNRRRDTNEAFPFPANTLASPASNSRFSREESSTVTPPPALVRRRTDFKEPAPGGAFEERDKEKGAAENAGPFGSLKRTTTAPFSSTAGTSPWPATTPSGGFSPMGAFGSFANPQSEKRPGFGSVRGESRFKGLMSKGSSEDMDRGAKEKPSLGNLGKLSEAESTRQTPSWMEARSNRPMSNDTDPFPDEELRAGSAALGGGQDMSPPRLQGIGTFSTPHRQDQRDETGFSAFGMTSDNTGLRDIFHSRDNLPHQTPQHRSGGDGHEPMSPTDTNPYQSPDHDRTDNEDAETDGSDIQNTHFPGMGSFQVDPSAGSGLHSFGGLGSLGRASAPFEVAASDRSQTSSTGPSRGFPSIPGLGGLPGLGGASAWPPGQQSIGTPVRERALGGGFDSMFGSIGELQSPSLAGLGSNSLFGPGTALGATGTIGRSSKLGSLFPAAMQDQMRPGEQHRPSVDEGSATGERQHSIAGTFGRGAFGSQAPGSAIPVRDTDSPFRTGRGFFEDFPGGLESANRDNRSTDIGMPDPIGSTYGMMQSSGPTQSSILTSTAQPNINPTRTAQPSTTTPSVSSPSSQPPAPQQRTMVMPDRMRWIYRDPQGNTQGPWSGLEMHDWYKAGFFSPELLVKKFEDPEYEPLAQLIRRIGNSREPFLVPQIGIPHGPPTTQPGNIWPGSGPATGGAAAGAQPPFAGSFPSFGTTLTADQQNALERRKQEEQYLMARQKEHLAAQQQALAKQAQLGMSSHGILPNQLHHHSSAHSLHSQPSFGSITSPGGYQPSPTQGPVPGGPAVPGLFDSSFRPGPAPVPGLGPIGPGMDSMLGNIREEDIPGMMDRLNLGRTGQLPFGTAPMSFGQQQPESNTHAQQVVAMLNDRARLQREQAEHDALQRVQPNDHQAAQVTADRLQQFHDLRVQTDMDQLSAAPPSSEGIIRNRSAPTAELEEPISPESSKAQRQPLVSSTQDPATFKAEPLSLTEQVQKAASAKQSPVPQSPWAKVDQAIHPFPPPPSQSPLPAPAAQRKPIIADSLAGESRSRSETPSAETPSASIAPWAKEPTEAPRGPSLKEIQEAEARKAAEREEIAAAARRQALQQELAAQAQSPAAQPGLPSSSTWASGASPITPGGASQSAWAKPLAGKAPSQQGTATKKTLQQIQKEEEARKQRAAAAAATASAVNAFGASNQGLSSGKRYADLASKHTPTQPSVGGAWTTVGASGKAKPPVGLPSGPPPAVRSTSTSIAPPAVKKAPIPRSTTLGTQLAGKANAEEEFRKWAVGELRPDLNKNINADEFVASLLSFPPDIELITESVHSASNTLDSRHFAEEFLRRRKLADKGIVDSTTTPSPSDPKAGSGGWSEVAKKGGQSGQQQGGGLDSGNFKVVAAKKKGSKR